MNPLKLIGLALGLTVIVILFSGFTPDPCSDASDVFAGAPVSACDINLGK